MKEAFSHSHTDDKRDIRRLPGGDQHTTENRIRAVPVNEDFQSGFFSSSENKEKKNSHITDIVFVRHGQRGVRRGSMYLTEHGRQQADATGRHLRTLGVNPELYDTVEALSSYSGDTDPVSALPRAAETITLVSRAMGLMNHKGLMPTRYSHIELNRSINVAHYNHDALLNSHLPNSHRFLSPKEKSRIEHLALTKTIDVAMRTEGIRGYAYRKEIAGMAAFLISQEIFDLQNRKSSTSKLLFVGGHSTFLEFLFQEALIWRDAGGTSRKGFNDLQDIGGPLDYAEPVCFRLAIDADNSVNSIQVLFAASERPVRHGYLDIISSMQLAAHYADLHDITTPKKI